MKKLPISCNGWFLLPGFMMNLFGTIYRRKSSCERELLDSAMNHEGIHECQTEDFISNPKNKKWIKKLNYIIFYTLYGIEGLIKGIMSVFTLFNIRAYKSISFEQEAYYNDKNFTYQDTRKEKAWTKYIFKLVWKTKK